MKISALVFDLDGTAIPKRPDGIPSQADWIAPHVDDDGLAVAIRKFVLA